MTSDVIVDSGCKCNFEVNVNISSGEAICTIDELALIIVAKYRHPSALARRWHC